MIIDATNLILGKMASKVAKLALLGESITIVNCEKAIVSGNKVNIFAHYKQQRDRTVPMKGPYISRMPDRIVRRTIRGMLPHKVSKGIDAFNRVRCFIGIPSELKNSKMDSLGIPTSDKLPNLKYVTIKEISASLGANVKNL